ncbi:MAG: hypothetical protein V7703_22605, partial [Hyphomicrobiales bacterium]
LLACCFFCLGRLGWRLRGLFVYHVACLAQQAHGVQITREFGLHGGQIAANQPIIGADISSGRDSLQLQGVFHTSKKRLMLW